MELNDYKKLSENEWKKYDFTEDWKLKNDDALSAYKKLSLWEKHFVYKMSNAVEEPKKVYKNARNFWEKVRQDYAEKKGRGYQYFLIDPDSESALLQEIYGKLWDETVLKLCSDENGQIHGDTMNSITTTMSRYIYHVFENDKDYYGGTSGNGFVGYCGSFSQSTEIYLQKKDTCPFEEREDFSKATAFIEINHTLGNFIPVPFENDGGQFNASRYGSTNDYWDLTLYYIYLFYETVKNIAVIDMENSLQKACCCTLFEGTIGTLLGEKCADVNLCIKWLCCFVDDDGKPSWDKFVEENYLQPYVSQNGDSYGIPLLLWSNETDVDLEDEKNWDAKKLEEEWGKRVSQSKEEHDKKNMPQSKDICEMFFKNARHCIEERTELMLDELKRRLSK